MGARGIKVWKPLGLRARDPQGHVVAVDDERLDPFWAMARRLDLPVVVHVADPDGLLRPARRAQRALGGAGRRIPTGTSGRREGRDRRPTLAAGFTAFDEILAAFDRVIGRHPETTFIGAHVGCAAEDLALVSSMLDRHPNYHVDISARMASWAGSPTRRAPSSCATPTASSSARTWATTRRCTASTTASWRRWDESFDYSTDEVPPQGRWQICGLGLPDDVLRKVYAENARRLILDR